MPCHEFATLLTGRLRTAKGCRGSRRISCEPLVVYSAKPLGPSTQGLEGNQSRVVVERTGRQVRRISLDGTKSSLSFPEQQSQQAEGSLSDRSLDALKGFALPRGWPQSVTPDYLQYQLWAVPSHITGWISVSLATSSLLKALGASPAGIMLLAFLSATAGRRRQQLMATALGLLQALQVGGRLGGVFDEDPRRWRLAAEAFATIGLALEIATAFNPGLFVVLAGGGNFSKAVGKGLGKPCFRIIQTHFALQNNVGDISAKEEVWEVAAQLAGLACSVALLRGIESAHMPALVLPAWATAQGAHVLLRYRSLRTLRFAFLNQKRACAAVSAYLQARQVPSVDEANRSEPLLAMPGWVTPRVTLGCSLQTVLSHLPQGFTEGPVDSGHVSADTVLLQTDSQQAVSALAVLAELYRDHQYMLLWDQGRAWVLLRDGIHGQELLRPLLQAAWLEAQGLQAARPGDLKSSLAEADALFPSFLSHLTRQGWDLDATSMPSGPARLQW